MTEVVCVKPPDVPVTVTVKPPVEVVLLAARVSVLVPVVLDGLKKAFTPFGKPEAVKLTLPVKPFCGVTAMTLVPLEPCVRLTLLGEAERAKFGAPFTVRLTVVVLVRLPEVPVIVTVAAPAAALLLAESVNVLVIVAPPGLKDAVTPVGRPDADKLTVPLKPPSGATLMVLLPFDPCTSVRLFGDAVRAKP